jgi:amidohydrolase
MDRLLQESHALLPGVVELRRSIHLEPEVGLDLPLTQAKILHALEGLPLIVEAGKATSSVTAALVGSRPGRSILLRGDMDALPLQEATGLDFASRFDGRMHACGHDAHVAMLVGAARLLAPKQADLAGSVKFMFQPGEEEPHRGAVAMIEEGLLENPTVDAAFALHADPSNEAGSLRYCSGPALASSDVFTIVVRGRGGHASRPHAAADPIPVACEIVQALQTIMTRSVDVFAPGVLTVAKIVAGTTTNIIPETATMQGTVRTLGAGTRSHILQAIGRVAHGVADAHGLTAEVHIDEGYPVTINDPASARFLGGVARRVLGEDLVQEQRFPNLATDDFAYVLERVPGALVSLGSRPRGMSESPPPHSNRYLFGEEAMAAGIAVNAALVLEFLQSA